MIWKVVLVVDCRKIVLSNIFKVVLDRIVLMKFVIEKLLLLFLFSGFFWVEKKYSVRVVVVRILLIRVVIRNLFEVVFELFLKKCIIGNYLFEIMNRLRNVNFICVFESRVFLLLL